MKTNDENAKLPPEQRPFRILIIPGSGRRPYNFPRVWQKGKVPPGKYRAVGHKGPKPIWGNVKDGIRYINLALAKPPKSFSPQVQQELDLRKDATWHTKKEEGQKLRDND